MQRALVAPVISAAVFALGWMVYMTGRYSRHEKLTVTVETQAGEVSGSSVSAVSWCKHWIQTGGMVWTCDVAGETVLLEAAPGRFLFARLKGAGTTEYLGSVAAASISGREERVKGVLGWTPNYPKAPSIPKADPVGFRTCGGFVPAPQVAAWVEAWSQRWVPAFAGMTGGGGAL